MKECIKCNELKQFDCFRVYKERIINTCKKCESIRSTQWKRENKEKVKEYYEKYSESANLKQKEKYHTDKEYRDSVLSKSRDRYVKNPMKKLLAGARRRSKMINLPFDVEESDLTIPEFCPILGIKLGHFEGQASDNSASIDKIIPELGYVKGNVQVISCLANKMKTSATPDQLKLFAEWVLSNYEELKARSVDANIDKPVD